MQKIGINLHAIKGLTDEEYIEKKDFDDYVRYSLATHNYFVNPLKDDK